LIRWSMQENRRIAAKLGQRQIQPAHIIAWSTWRRAHQCRTLIAFEVTQRRQPHSYTQGALRIDSAFRGLIFYHMVKIKSLRIRHKRK
jgi:hypothetical protein